MMRRACHISTMMGWGGVERMLIDMLLYSGTQRFSHYLMSTSSSEELLNVLSTASIPTFEPHRRFQYDPSAIGQMVRWLKTSKIEVVHVYNSVASTWGGLAAMLARTPALIGGEHGTVWSVGPPYSWFNRLIYQRAQVVIANSEASRLLINHRFGIPYEKVKVIYNTIPSQPGQAEDYGKLDLPFFDRSKLIVGSVGRLTPQKNYSVLIDAATLAIRRNRNITFVLIGGGEQEQYLRKRITEQGLEDHFFLTGWRSDARELIRGFDIFVSTSLYEPFGNVLIEAALAGKPVIAPAVDGIPEAVSDGETGLLIKPTVPIARNLIESTQLPKHVVVGGRLVQPHSLDPHDLAEAILSMAGNSAQRTDFGVKGSIRAERLFNLPRYIHELEATYTLASKSNGSL